MNNHFIEFENVDMIFPNVSINNSHNYAPVNISTGLKDLSFKINTGDHVGLLGPNGAGKTTLLRLINKIYVPTNGKITINGSVLSLLDISMGLDSDANGYDNIILRGLILGLTHEEIKSKIDEIKEFSELGDYLAAPIRIYSSGMKVRLAFSIITVMKPQILVLDEWLSVGDENFNKKASKKLKEMVEETAILVIASHSKDILNKVCNRIFLLEDGKINKEIDRFA